MSDDFDKLGNFINSIGATRLLLEKAHKQHFLIEGLVLYAAIVDGFCRISLVLKQQIDNKSQEIDSRYIFKSDESKNYISEREIYRLSLKKFILDKELFDEINSLYDIRNKTIHNFLITEIEYSHLGLILDRYELVYQRLWTIVYRLESEQIAKGVGMTISGSISGADKEIILKNINKKINSNDSRKLIKTLGNKLIKDADKFSEENERNFVADEISDEIEIQKEKKVIPPGYASVKEIVKWAERKKMFEKCSCGHEKIYHVDKDRISDVGNIENCFKKCNVNKCNCREFSK